MMDKMVTAFDNDDSNDGDSDPGLKTGAGCTL